MGDIVPFRRPFYVALINLIDQYKQELVVDVIRDLRKAADTLDLLDKRDDPPKRRT